MSHGEATRRLVQDVTDNAEKLGKKKEKDKMTKVSNTVKKVPPSLTFFEMSKNVTWGGHQRIGSRHHQLCRKAGKKLKEKN